MSGVPPLANTEDTSTAVARQRDHLPPLLRGLGFLLILLASLFVGIQEHRANVETRTRMTEARARMDAAARHGAVQPRVDALALEIRLLRLQLQEQDFADRVLESPLFQLLGSLGSGLVAASFFLEARAKWPARAKA